MSVTKTFHLPRGVSFAAHLGWSYRGRRFDSLEASSFTRQDPYSLLDGRATLQWDAFTVSFWGTNLLDRQYTLSRGGNPGDNVQRVYRGPPRMFGVELGYAMQ